MHKIPTKFCFSTGAAHSSLKPFSKELQLILKNIYLNNSKTIAKEQAKETVLIISFQF